MRRLVLLLLINAFIVSIALSQSVPLPPTNLTVSNVTSSSFEAKWTASIGAFSYRMDLSTSSNFSTGNIFIGRGTPLTSDTTYNLNPGTTYFFRVRAVNASGVSANSFIRSLVLVPAAPQGFWHHVANAYANEPYGFSTEWHKSQGATGYRMDVSTSKTFDTFVYKNIDAGATFSADSLAFTPAHLPPSHVYYYRVRAVNSLGVSGNSPVDTVFQLLHAPVGNPATNISSSAFTANWSFDLPASNFTFKVEVSRDPLFTNLLFNPRIANGTSLNISLPTAGEADYYYRVNVLSIYGYSLPSNVVKVHTPPPGLASQSIDVYPNPVHTSDYVNVDIKDLAPRAAVRVNITSLSDGKTIQYDFEADNDGLLNSRIPVTMLNPGTYVLKVGDKTSRFVVTHSPN